jgi:hypothetical protein
LTFFDEKIAYDSLEDKAHSKQVVKLSRQEIKKQTTQIRGQHSVFTFSFAWISRSFRRASTWMWELT